MKEEQLVTDDVGGLTRYDYDDGTTVLVMDCGANAAPSIDVVESTAIVVVGGEQFEFELPDGEARAFMKNGVVGVEVDR
ncbi:hypothetical protein [Halocatena halophila]|uniref:hypothetical protein n=1 Tax=Halocatena halophila TaxID=2814576 RepID=UPI002ED27C5E